MISTYRGTALDMIFANWTPIVHGVEGGNLIHTHWRHFQKTSNLIHDADACEAVLTLAEIEKWHHCRFLVLRWVASKNLSNELLIFRSELERYRGIVLGRVSML
jgi:hypothetical protein